MQHHCHRLRSILGLPSLSTKPPRRHSSSQAPQLVRLSPAPAIALPSQL